MKKNILAFIFLIATMPSFGQWVGDTAVNNVVINSDKNDYASFAVTDGANGSIIFSQNSESPGDIYAQKITSSGTIAWGSATSPVAICVTTEDKQSLYAIADGSGGAFVTWADYRYNSEKEEIFIQRINSAGVAQWSTNGIRVTNNNTRDDEQPLLCSDGAGGVIVSWYGDDSLNAYIQSYAQRYNGAGVAQWTANGVQVCTATGFRGANAMVSDGHNGAIIFFLDSRNDPHGNDYRYLNSDTTEGSVNLDIYAQRLNGSGSRQWTNNGVAIVTAPHNQQGFGIAIADGSGGAIFPFNDERNDNGKFTNFDAYAQRVNSSGATMWATNGVAISTAAGNQFLTGAVSDGAGGIIGLFINSPFGLNVQRITGAGTVAWPVGGVAITQPGEPVSTGSLVEDGTGNTIIAYQGRNYSGGSAVKAQKINSAGSSQWGKGTIISDTGYPDNITITQSDNGSAIIGWNNDLTGVSNEDVYASKVLANGSLAGAAAITAYITAANGNWNNPASWVGGVVPPAGASVIIHHTINGNVNASCSSLKIEKPGGNLTVLSGFHITVTN